MASSCEITEALINREQAYDSAPTQEELRECYEEQQCRLVCPTCGEEPFFD
jgi:hypothetical protein